MDHFDLSEYHITVSNVLRNASVARLYEEALGHEKGTRIASNGALIAYSGKKTGRSPTDKRIVKNPETEHDIWWGNVNIPLSENVFMINRERAIDYLNTRPRIYCVDGYAGWDPAHRIKIRVICERAYQALFMHNMLIRPTPHELEQFGKPDYVIYNAGKFPANRFTSGMTSQTSVDLCFEDREFVILGTEYAGEMKKGVFTIMNYLLLKQGILSMHCSATEDKHSGESSVMFGLSGTGKTTLSADPRRTLIGDDEHGWGENGVFNIEGGCYAKVIDLKEEYEPDIYKAIRFGSVLENVVFDPSTHDVRYEDTSITQNTRGCYPIEYIENIKMPCMTGHPKHVIFLTCDAFGVLPPVARLSPQQAMYHFISGYTAKVAGTEMGVSEPQATFSPCFGGPFLVWHPGKYAMKLAEKIEAHGSSVWLVNTGWTGGGFGRGQRMPITETRAIIDAIHSNALNLSQGYHDEVFGFYIPQDVPGVDSIRLVPKETWGDAAAYDKARKHLAALFAENFKKYAQGLDPSILEAGPKVTS